MHVYNTRPTLFVVWSVGQAIVVFADHKNSWTCIIYMHMFICIHIYLYICRYMVAYGGGGGGTGYQPTTPPLAPGQ